MGFRLYKVEVRLSLWQQKTPHALLWRVRRDVTICPLSIGLPGSCPKMLLSVVYLFPLLGEPLVRNFSF